MQLQQISTRFEGRGSLSRAPVPDDAAGAQEREFARHRTKCARGAPRSSPERHDVLDVALALALMTALLRGHQGRGGREVRPVKFFETLRDWVVLRSQIGKRKLDRSAIRRELDQASRELGERFAALVRRGRAEAPGELRVFLDAVQLLEEKLAAQEKEIAELEGEFPRRK